MLDLGVRAAQSKPEAREVHTRLGLSKEEFAERFPSLEKVIQNLPDEPPSA